MKPFKSIKWRLQLWYGLILVVVLAGFGVTAFELEKGWQMRRVDGELQRRFRILAEKLHPNPPAFLQNRPRPGGPPDQLPGGLPPRPNPKPERFELSPWEVNLFGTNQPNGFYFIIESRDGKEIARGGEVPATEIGFVDDAIHINRMPTIQEVRPERAMKPPPVFMLNGFREIWDPTPSGESIRVGCSIAPELHELHIASLELLAIGGIILFVGLAGGWKIIKGAIRPIEQISFAAARISSGDLSQRINVAEAESELGKLAAVLNSTFARLDAAFAQQKQFASDAAHELRTPVSVILTQTQTALNRERSAAEYRETLEACQRAAQRMRKLIVALLELARLDAGQEVLNRHRFDLAQTIADCVELARPLAEERKVKILTELSPVEIAGDAGRLAQVVTNLLANAIQYSRENGEVHLNLKSEGGLAVLTVADTGQGIAAVDAPHVFERFYRGDQSRTGENAGLGLAISKAIITAHGGVIEVSSQEDVGTTFTVRLPV